MTRVDRCGDDKVGDDQKEVLQRLQIEQNARDFVVAYSVAQRRHVAAAMQDGCANAIVIRRCAAWQVGLLVDAQQRRAVQRSTLAVVVAGAATRGVGDVADLF